jgi:hypothetical protein
VQNLHWIADRGILVLIQNTRSGKGWRFTYVHLEKSIKAGKEHVLKVVDIDREDELEGFTFVTGQRKGIAVSSARTRNINMMDVDL